MNNKKENFTGAGGFFGWKPAAWLRVTGEDAATFLQGQFTNELRGLEAGGAVYGLWLNHKGRVIADSFVVRGRAAEEFWVGSYFSEAEVIKERLEAFVIADDVVIEDATDGWTGLSVLGAVGLEVGGERRTTIEVAGGFVFRGRRSNEENWEVVYPIAAGESEVVRGVTEELRALSAEEMERMRIEAGIPAVPCDLGMGELPNEGGLEATGISYTKGCYLGQEVMARLKSMGQVRRRLLRVRGAGAVPELPAGLFQRERRVGELRSAVSDVGGEASGFVGLALVSLLNLQAEAPISYSPEGDGVVTIVERS